MLLLDFPPDVAYVADEQEGTERTDRKTVNSRRVLDANDFDRLFYRASAVLSVTLNLSNFSEVAK